MNPTLVNQNANLLSISEDYSTSISLLVNMPIKTSVSLCEFFYGSPKELIFKESKFYAASFPTISPPLHNLHNPTLHSSLYHLAASLFTSLWPHFQPLLRPSPSSLLQPLYMTPTHLNPKHYGRNSFIH